MSDHKLKQLQYEAATWKRFLGYMMEENVHLKNRLSEILNSDFDKKHLDTIADFLGEFIKADQVIGVLRHEVAELDKLLTKAGLEEGQLINLAQEKIGNVRLYISNAEKKSGELMTAFNKYILDSL